MGLGLGEQTQTCFTVHEVREHRRRQGALPDFRNRQSGFERLPGLPGLSHGHEDHGKFPVEPSHYVAVPRSAAVCSSRPTEARTPLPPQGASDHKRPCPSTQARRRAAPSITKGLAGDRAWLQNSQSFRRTKLFQPGSAQHLRRRPGQAVFRPEDFAGLLVEFLEHPRYAGQPRRPKEGSHPGNEPLDRRFLLLAVRVWVVAPKQRLEGLPVVLSRFSGSQAARPLPGLEQIVPGRAGFSALL